MKPIYFQCIPNDYFLGDSILDEGPGLDILGLRGLDQAIEASLVNGITTISIRARYFTILPWAIGTFTEIDTSNGAVLFDIDRLNRFMRRVQFLILAATIRNSHASSTRGALGSDLWDDDDGRPQSWS